MDISIYPGLRCLVALPMFLISLAFLFGALGMTYRAVLQHYIYIANPCNSFVSCGDLFSVFAWIQFPQLNSISDVFTNITELEYGCNKVPKWMNSVVMNIVSFMTVIGSAISAAVASVTEDQQLEGNYTRIAIATFLAGMAFYVGFWRRGRYGEEEDATGKGRRMESDMTPVVDSGVRKFLGLIYSYNTKEVFEKGFRKHPNSAFRAYVFPFGKVTVLTNRGLIDEMNHAPPDHLSFDEVSRMLIQPDHTTFGRAPQLHPIAVIQQNFNRRLDLLLPGMFDDIKTAVDAALDHTAGGWRSIVVHKFAEKVTSKAALRAIVGSPLCESLEVGNIIYAFATNATKSASWINLFPRALHFIVGPLLSSAGPHQKRLTKAIIPIVDDRRQKLKELGCEWVDKPNDYLMCLIESAPPGQNYESSYEGIATRLLQFGFASFHTSGNALSHLLFDLAAAPSHGDKLREEMSGIIDYEGLTKQSMQTMCLTDSFMTESARLNPVGISVDRSSSIGLTSLTRFAHRSYTFSCHKVVLPKGTVVMAPMNSIHRDENIYPTPNTFEPWRFANLKDRSAQVVKNPYTSITPHYLYFGHGKQACPGRFFVGMELKAILCYIMMNYDIKIEDGIRPPNDELGIGVLPSTTAEIMIRQRLRTGEAMW